MHSAPLLLTCVSFASGQEPLYPQPAPWVGETASEAWIPWVPRQGVQAAAQVHGRLPWVIGPRTALGLEYGGQVHLGSEPQLTHAQGLWLGTRLSLGKASLAASAALGLGLRVQDGLDWAAWGSVGGLAQSAAWFRPQADGPAIYARIGAQRALGQTPLGASAVNLGLRSASLGHGVSTWGHPRLELARLGLDLGWTLAEEEGLRVQLVLDLGPMAR